MKKLDISSVLREVATKSVIWETPNIKRAITYMKNNRLTLRTDGINFHVSKQVTDGTIILFISVFLGNF